MDSITVNKDLDQSLKWSQIENVDYIKSGSFGSVFKYKNKSNPKMFYAVKMVKYDPKEDDQEKIKEEIKLLEYLLKIPNSVIYFPKYYGYANLTKHEGNRNTEFNALVFELGAGNLKRFCESFRPEGIHYQENLMLLECFTMGLGMLQEKRIAHRDIKPENIIFFEENKKLSSFKIIDFGEVKMGVGEEGTLRGSPPYLSPEANFKHFSRVQQLTDEYNPFKSDIYSIGLTLLFCNCGSSPFFDQNLKKLDRTLESQKDPLKNNKGPYDEKIAKMIDIIIKKFQDEKGVAVFKIILTKCLEYNPLNRFDILSLKGAFQVLKEIEGGGVEELLSLKEKQEIAVLEKKSNDLQIEKNEILKQLEEEKKSRQKLQNENQGLKAEIQANLEESKRQMTSSVNVSKQPNLMQMSAVRAESDDPEGTLINMRYVPKEKNPWEKTQAFMVRFYKKQKNLL